MTNGSMNAILSFFFAKLYLSCSEPPQGDVVQIVPKSSEDGVQYLKVTKGRWQLSEDPEDRKDGLWIWGLFKEPLYPFMLLQIETDEYSLPGEEGDAIQPLKMYAQINHKRDKNTGEVELDAATLNIREIESIKGKIIYVARKAWFCQWKTRSFNSYIYNNGSLTLSLHFELIADPFGAAKIDIYEEVKCGQLSLRPLIESSAINATL